MRKRWKRSFVTALSVALAVGNCVPAMAAPTGWQKSAAGWQYVNENGSIQKGWFQDAKGDWYFLDYNTGVMKTGWVKPADGNWYFMDYHTGAMKTGWIKPMDGNWYYLNPVSNGTKGAMKTGWIQTPDSKWYYLNASGAMQTGTITVGDKVWTLDANGVWNGKDATEVTYVSSGNKGGSSHTTNKNPAIVKDGDNVTINSANFVASALDKEIKGNLTINAKLDKDDSITLSGITVKGNLIIEENVGEGTVNLDNVTVEGDTEIKGGGSESVIFNRCKLKKVIANKSLSSSNTAVKPLHIKFGEGTEVGEVEAKGGQLHLETEVVIQKVISSVAILLSGSGNGSIANFQITAPVSVNIQVNVTKVEVTSNAVQGGAAPEITVGNSSTVGAVDGAGVDNVVITGEGTVVGYYEITLNPNGGYWVVEDIANNTTSQDNTAKKVKVKTGESIGTVLSAEGFKSPENGSKVFSGWYTAATDGTKVDMAAGEEVKGNEFFAGWADNKVAVTSAEITGATDGKAKAGDTLTAVANQDATGVLSYQWMSCATADGTYSPIAEATKSVYTVQEADADKFIKVTISGDNNSSVTSDAVQVEKQGIVDPEPEEVTVKTVTVTVATSGSSIAPQTVDVTDNKATVTVTTSGSAITVDTISASAEDANGNNVEVETTLNPESTSVPVGESKEIQVVVRKKEDQTEVATITVTIINQNQTEN